MQGAGAIDGPLRGPSSGGYRISRRMTLTSSVESARQSGSEAAELTARIFTRRWETFAGSEKHRWSGGADRVGLATCRAVGFAKAGSEAALHKKRRALAGRFHIVFQQALKTLRTSCRWTPRRSVGCNLCFGCRSPDTSRTKKADECRRCC
jgi:hypothetical protein